MSGYSERSTRSRVSSPYAGNGTPQPTNGLADPAKKKTFMDRWVEPPRPAPRPSFAEAGFERGGTVANMAPLGTLPSSKIIKSVARSETKDSTERVRREEASNATTPEPPFDTPESTAPPPPHDSPTPQPEPEISQPSPQTPRDQMSAPPSPQKMDVDDPDLLDPDVLGMSPLPEDPTNEQRRSISVTSPPPRYIRHRGEAYTPELDDEGLPIVDLEFTDKVIEDAVQIALDAKRWPTAYALRTLYDDLRTDLNFVRIIEAIYYDRATSKELGEFYALVRVKKREGKTERTAEYYFNGDEQYEPPPISRPVLDAVSAALTYDNLRPGSARSTGDLTRGASIPLQSPSNPSFPPQYPFGAPGMAMGIPPALPHLTTYVTPYGMGPPRAYASPYGPNAANIVPPPNPAYSMNMNGAPMGMTTRAHRSGSESSSSSLSSIDEELIQSHEVEDEDEEMSYADSPKNVKNGAFQRGRGAADGSKPKIRLTAGNRKNATAAPQHPLAGSANTNANANAHSISTRARSDNSNLPSRNSTPAETLVSQTHNGQPSTNGQPMANTAPPKVRQGPKIHTFKTSTIPTSSTASTPTQPTSSTPGRTTNNSANTNGDMAPARLLPDSATASISSKTSDTAAVGAPKGKLASKNKKQNIIQNSNIPPYNKNDEISRLKRAARKTTNAAGEIYVSEERHPVLPPPPNAAEDTASEGGDYLPLPSKRPKGGRIVLTTRETRNRYNDNSENSSPTLLSFQPDIAPGSVSVSVSRAGTPLTRPTRKAKTGSGLRVKTSPVKKKGGIVAGVPRDSRLSGERTSPGPGGTENRDDNDDFCAACGGNGDIVCCDGCNKSFHFKCIDPPMIEGSLPDSWFCNTCEAKHNPTTDESQYRIFGALIQNLKSKNPESFRLPDKIRNYFEGVQTGAEGEYEEPTPPKTAKNRGGYDEVPDYFRTKDSKGKLILCHSCDGTASAPSRAIIPCSFCGLYWHLDCLENPMAKEPHISRQWRCPAHIDDILDVLPALLGPAHRWRRIKGTQPIALSIPRGGKNNGHIEIDNSVSDDDEEKGFSDEVQYGMVYRLPEEGIKLDFISKVKQKGGGISRSGYLNRQISAPQVAPLHTRELVVQQAALNLAALATQAPPLSIDNLVNTLQFHAPPVVLDMMTWIDPSSLAQKAPMSASDRENLEKLHNVLGNLLAAPPPATEVKDDYDLGEPARKKAKMSNSVDADEDNDDLAETAQKKANVRNSVDAEEDTSMSL